MNSLTTNTASFYRATVLVVAASLGACGEDNGVDYCKNHYVFHSDHLDSLANLTIILSDTGDLEGNLSMPEVVFGEISESDTSSILGDPDNTFTLQTESPCTVSVKSISPTADGINASFEASCGPDNKVGRIDVALFDHITALEEVVVSITTPATNKRFGISRQCDGPIFRLD